MTQRVSDEELKSLVFFAGMDENGPKDQHGRNLESALLELQELRAQNKWIDGTVEVPKVGEHVLIEDRDGNLHFDEIVEHFGNFKKESRTDYEFRWRSIPSPTKGQSHD